VEMDENVPTNLEEALLLLKKNKRKNVEREINVILSSGIRFMQEKNILLDIFFYFFNLQQNKTLI